MELCGLGTDLKTPSQRAPIKELIPPEGGAWGLFKDSVLFNVFITELGQTCHACRWCEAGRDRKYRGWQNLNGKDTKRLGG